MFSQYSTMAITPPISDIVSQESIELTGFYDMGGQNKIYKGKMTDKDGKITEIITKTA